jgi:hypothetical protein
MVRHEKSLGPVHVAWGYDEPLQGYFFSATDDCLSWQEDQTAEVDKIVEVVAGDGGGSYFNLHTYAFGGFGHKVSKETIFAFMRRYDIDPEKIGSENALDGVGSNGGGGGGGAGGRECAHPDCRIPETVDKHKRCGRCRNAWYCSKKCQTEDWKSHKVNCLEP